MVFAGSGGQQTKPAALVLLDCRHPGFTDTGGKADPGVTRIKPSVPCLDLPGFRELENVLTACAWGQQLGRQVVRAEEFPFPSVDLCWGRGISRGITNHLFADVCGL